MITYGFLAIWCDISADDLDDYRNWLTQEHIADRTFSPGFLGVRLFEALDDPKSHFILYATEGAEVLDGPAYKRILDNPSPWTKRIMPRFGPFDRALGTQVLKVGNGVGAAVAIWRISLETPEVDIRHIERSLSEYCGKAGVVSIRLCALSRETTDRFSEEKTMRGDREGDFDYLLVAETLNGTAAKNIEARLTGTLRLIFPRLSGFDSSCRRMIYGEGPYEGPSSSKGVAP